MSDALVSSRISKAKKEAGVAALEAMGATMSDLINDAVDYVIANGKMPTSSAGASRKAKRAAEFQAFVEASTLDVDWGAEPVDYDDILRQGKVADYESLA